MLPRSKPKHRHSELGILPVDHSSGPRSQLERDVATGKEVGDLSLKTINKNFQKTKIVGLRYLATYMHPNNLKPEKVFVLGCVTVDFAGMAKEIRDNMVTAEDVRDVLELKHRANMLRFDAVEKEYLKQREDRLRQKGYLIDAPTE